MTDSRPAPFFVGGAPALDFLNSIATPIDVPVEWITSGEHLVDWLRAANMVPPDVLAAMRRMAVPGELDGVAAQARALREWFRGFVEQHRGKPLRPDTLSELAPLNRVLERDQEYWQIVKRDRAETPAIRSGLAWRPLRRWQAPDTLLQPIAKAMAELACNEDFSHVRGCDRAPCTLFFLDRTNGHRRRWCSMAVCGNRAKQAAYRKRERRVAT